MTPCSFEGCKNKIKNHYWGHVKAEDWFFQKDGRVWCPDHIPDWVHEWRKKKQTNKLKAELEFDKVKRQIKEKEHELQKLKVDQHNIKQHIMARKGFLKSLKVL